ncbi:MAG: AraC family ligand binding domain-containing protein [Spirosomataceae bacterium]
MKAQLLKISNKIAHSFSVRHDIVPVYHNKWHYHPEIEIIYIRKGKGTYIIGDRIDSFEANDIYVLGSNLPHLFRYDNNDQDNYSDAYVIHCLPAFFSEDFLRHPEMKAVKDLIRKSLRGIQMRLKHPEVVNILFENLFNSDGFSRIISYF